VPPFNSVNTPIAISSPIDPCSKACRVKIDVVCTPLGASSRDVTHLRDATASTIIIDEISEGATSGIMVTRCALAL
jgi:hypothetical protein